jgi:hypothetical protein
MIEISGIKFTGAIEREITNAINHKWAQKSGAFSVIKLGRKIVWDHKKPEFLLKSAFDKEISLASFIKINNEWKVVTDQEEINQQLKKIISEKGAHTMKKDTAAIKKAITANIMGSNEVQEILMINRSRLHALVEAGKLEPIKELKREGIFFKPEVMALKVEMLKDSRTNLYKKEVLNG